MGSFLSSDSVKKDIDNVETRCADLERRRANLDNAIATLRNAVPPPKGFTMDEIVAKLVEAEQLKVYIDEEIEKVKTVAKKEQ
jgi:hypothetical protein